MRNNDIYIRSGTLRMFDTSWNVANVPNVLNVLNVFERLPKLLSSNFGRRYAANFLCLDWGHNRFNQFRKMWIGDRVMVKSILAKLKTVIVKLCIVFFKKPVIVKKGFEKIYTIISNRVVIVNSSMTKIIIQLEQYI